MAIVLMLVEVDEDAVEQSLDILTDDAEHVASWQLNSSGDIPDKDKILKEIWDHVGPPIGRMAGYDPPPGVAP